VIITLSFQVWPFRSQHGDRSGLSCGVATVVEQRSRRPLRVARRREFSAIETVESTFGREETESVLVTRDDAGCSVVDFDDVCFGHNCSFAEIPALLSGYDLASWIYRDQRQAPVAAEIQRRVARLRISPVTGAIFDLMRQLSVEQFPARDYPMVDRIGQ
jgi:hypothetical protein